MLIYSSVPNRHACIEKKFPPALFWSARLLILRENSPLHVYCILQVHWYFSCTFINFEKAFLPARPYFGLHV